MSDIRLFSLEQGTASELSSQTARLEKHLQQDVERNMPTLLGVSFLASEYSTGKTHRGRIDSLGLDENLCPVIIEYKRHSNENVINQGLFYLDWLLDHQAEFRWLVMETLDREAANGIEWNGTRLICIASDFNRYDEHAVQQINRNIELMRYRYFGDNLLLLELVNAQTAQINTKTAQIVPPADLPETSIPTTLTPATTTASVSRGDKSQQERLAEASPELLARYHHLCDYIESLGDEVQRKEVKLYTAFKRIRNFAAVLVMNGRDPRLQLYLNLPGSEAEGKDDKWMRDVSQIGHWATGDLEVNVRTAEQLEEAKRLVEKAYRES
jgi:predicted transport protein